MNNENNNNNNNDWAAREIGALWKKSGANQKYLSGKLKVGDDEMGVVIFTNRHKTQDKHPDFRVYLSESVASAADNQDSEAKTTEEVSEGIL